MGNGIKEEYTRWYSPTLGKEMEMHVYGHFGTPVIVFPTTMGRFYEPRDFKLIDSAHQAINSGKAKIYCVDSIDKHSWYNKRIHPAERVKNHNWYDTFIEKEVIDAICHAYSADKVALAGASFGAYHAANLAFKHPEKVSHLFCMSGSYDIRSFLNGYYDSNVYFNNPVDYLPGNQNPELWNMKIILGYGEWDICKDSTLQLSHILNEKGIAHWLDERKWAKHDWPMWRMMFPHYLSTL